MCDSNVNDDDFVRLPQQQQRNYDSRNRRTQHPGRGSRGWGRGDSGGGYGLGRGGRFAVTGGDHRRGGGRMIGNRGRGHGRRQSSSSPRPQFDGNDFIEELGDVSFDQATVSIAVEGCCHGELDVIYDRLVKHEADSGRRIDLLLICGDFQSLRNAADFHSIAVPPKYRTLGSFHRYYNGEKVAPFLTVFVGGNHESSQVLHELPYGGWVAPNIYYMGYAGVVSFQGLRIGGISGIYKSHDYRRGRFEAPPFDRSSIRSAYHVRNIDVYRLKCFAAASTPKPLDIMLSHDWPQGIEQHGDTAKLLRVKPHFRDEIGRNDLGSPANLQLLNSLKPRWWFAAHLHVKFKASFVHDTPLEASISSAADARTDLIPSQTIHSSGLDDTVSEPVTSVATDLPSPLATQFVGIESKDPCTGPDLTEQMTRFLSLDKCLPRRQYLSIVHIPVAERQTDARLQYDLDWLAVIFKTHELTQTHDGTVTLPSRIDPVTQEDIEALKQRLKDNLGGGFSLDIPRNFAITAPPHSGPPSPLPQPLPRPLPQMGNPQTDWLLTLLDLRHIATIPYAPLEHASQVRGPQGTDGFDENEIELESDGGIASGDEKSGTNHDEVVETSTIAETAIEESCDTDPLSIKKPRVGP